MHLMGKESHRFHFKGINIQKNYLKVKGLGINSLKSIYAYIHQGMSVGHLGCISHISVIKEYQCLGFTPKEASFPVLGWGQHVNIF